MHISHGWNLIMWCRIRDEGLDNVVYEQILCQKTFGQALMSALAIMWCAMNPTRATLYQPLWSWRNRWYKCLLLPLPPGEGRGEGPIQPCQKPFIFSGRRNKQHPSQHIWPTTRQGGVYGHRLYRRRQYGSWHGQQSAQGRLYPHGQRHPARRRRPAARTGCQMG